MSSSASVAHEARRGDEQRFTFHINCPDSSAAFWAVSVDIRYESGRSRIKAIENEDGRVVASSSAMHGMRPCSLVLLKGKMIDMLHEISRDIGSRRMPAISSLARDQIRFEADNLRERVRIAHARNDGDELHCLAAGCCSLREVWSK
jgi:hypothetical protein